FGVGETAGADQGRAGAHRSRGQHLRDLVLWALLTVPVMFGDWFARSVRPPWWQTGCGVLLLAVAVACSRRFPVAALLVVGGLGLATSPSLFTLSYGPALAVVGYLLGRRAQASRPALLAFTALAVTGTALVPQRSQDVAVGWLGLVATLLFGAVFPWLIGRHRRQDRALVMAGWSRAVQLEREQQIVADRARLRERARIAQDMHDSLGHDLALIALRAGALQIAPGLDPAHRAAARELRSAASDATERLREIIGVLRDAAGTDAGSEAGASVPGVDAVREPASSVRGEDMPSEPASRVHGVGAEPEPASTVRGADALPEPASSARGVVAGA
ncbi:histidine kinase dimerization/phosphoacceptor domain-containing protein, partial [Streptomyces palmae]